MLEPSTPGLSVADPLAACRIESTAERVGTDPETTGAVLRLARRVNEDASLERITRRLLLSLSAAPADALDELRRLELQRALPVEAFTYYLLLSLSQVPAVEARHAERGVPAAVTRATLADLSVWCRHFRKQTGVAGFSLEILEWAQSYLRGDLYRIGPLQFELKPFSGPLVALRDRDTGELRSLSLPGTSLGDVVTGNPIDSDSGAVAGEPISFDRERWEMALAPGTPMLRMHIPANSRAILADFVQATNDAFAFFARLAPDARPLGAWGEGWLLDPQVRALLPRHIGLHAIGRVLQRFPSRLPEAKTIRRLFGPEVTRDTLAAMPRDTMSSLQRRVADLLSSPGGALAATGGFILKREFEALLRAGVAA